MTRPRGSLVAYAIAFALMAAGGACVVVASLGTLEDLGLLRIASVLSGAAVVTAVISVVLPRRTSR